jgi:hypothetical protein
MELASTAEVGLRVVPELEFVDRKRAGARVVAAGDVGESSCLRHSLRATIASIHGDEIGDQWNLAPPQA